jgi:hypothetical protein
MEVSIMNVNYYVGMVKAEAKSIEARGPWKFDTAIMFKQQMEHMAHEVFLQDIEFVLIPDVVDYGVEVLNV